jgi:ribosomal protein L10
MKLNIVVRIFAAIALIFIAVTTLLPNDSALRSIASPITNLINPADVKTRLSFIHNRYRLKPDGRMLDAVGEIHNFLTKANKHQTEILMTDDGWDVRYGNEVVGSLPDLPNFDDYHTLLKQWAQKIITANNIEFTSSTPTTPTISPTTYNINRLLKSLQDTGIAWEKGNHNPELLAQALDSYTILAMLFIDSMEAYDVLSSRPLAFLILTQIADKKPHIREETLVAQTLGYTNHAYNLASKLSEEDPTRWYVENRVNDLRDAARAAQPSQEVLLYTLLTMAAEDKGDEELFELIRERFNDNTSLFPALKAVTMQHDFEITRELPFFLRYMLYQPLASEAENQTKEERKASSIVSAVIAGILNNEEFLPDVVLDFVNKILLSFNYDVDGFEQHISETTTQNAIGFITPEYYTAFFMAPFYSSFYIEARHDLYSLASLPELQKLINKLRNSKNDFSNSFAELLDTINGMNETKIVNSTRLRNALNNSPLVGHLPLQMLYNKAAELYAFDNLELFDIAYILAQKLDSRPKTRESFAWILYERIYDLKMAEYYFRGELALTQKTNIRTALTVATMSGNAADIKESLLLPNLSNSDRRNLFRKLRYANLPKEEVRELFTKEIELNPNDWETRYSYLNFLSDQKDYPAIISNAQSWIKQNPKDQGFPFILSNLKIATAYYNMGNFEEALKILRPIVPSGQGGVLNRTALTLGHLGRPMEAESMFRMAINRYPNALYIIQGQMGFFWQQHRYTEAANSFKGMIALSFENEDLKESAKLFVDALGNNEANAQKAFEALAQAGIHPERQNALANHIRDENPKLAFVLRKYIMNQVQEIARVFILIDAYNDLEKAQKKQYALAWLKQNVPQQLLNKMSMPIYEKRQYSLLWTFINPPNPNDSPEYVWLLRTAASAMEGFTDGKKDILLKHYQSLTSLSDYDNMARYILGLEKLETIYPLAERSNKKLGEVAYFIAVKFISDRNYADAQDWLMLSLSSGYKGNRENAWAMHSLNRLISSGKFLGSQDIE